MATVFYLVTARIMVPNGNGELIPTPFSGIYGVRDDGEYDLKRLSTFSRNFFKLEMELGGINEYEILKNEPITRKMARTLIYDTLNPPSVPQAEVREIFGLDPETGERDYVVHYQLSRKSKRNKGALYKHMKKENKIKFG